MEAIPEGLKARIYGPVAHLRTKKVIGASPYDLVSTKHAYAGFDSIDYYKHLSNSHYAKTLDSLRMKISMELFSAHFVMGGWIGVGETHYLFLKEVEPFTHYEIEMKVSGFNEKWMFFTATFLTTPKKSKKTRASPPGTPAYPSISGTNTPSGRTPTQPSGVLPRADGKTVHCISVTSYVWKVGRRTIPPSVVLSFNGYGKAANWARSEKLIAGGRKVAGKWLTEGWKEEEGVVEEFEEEGRRRAKELHGWRSVMETL
ncbi:hypothetical protein BDY24DRAFT_397022 [Mrakia frigida]|uniref:uncharacterized protein n=1 Tax=Mrakia frigida TaxID=29902 RepID=UPI003FCC09A5